MVIGMKEILYTILSEYVEPGFSINDSQTLADDLNLCSFDLMTIIMLAEDKTGKTANLDILVNNPTVGGLCDSFR